jgi:hypothetical protein
VINDHIILIGDVIHPGQPILQTMIGFQVSKMCANVENN